MNLLRIAVVLLISQSCFAQHWDSLGSGLNRYSTKLFTDSISDKLYAAGQFNVVNGDSIWGIASWNGSDWDSLGHGFDQYPLGPNYSANTWGLARYGNYLYAGGNFRYAGYTATTALARWDGTNWDSVPGAVLPQNKAVRNLFVYNNDLYICGTFDSIGGIAANCIARYDGISCHPVGNNFDFIGLNSGFLTQGIFYHGDLYVTGSFQDPAQATCSLAKWDGTSWQFLTGAVIGSQSGIWDMTIYNDELYVCGAFYQSNGNVGNCIMRWDGTNWLDAGGGTSVVTNPYPVITEMYVHNGKLYCTGNFEKIGGVEANGLAVWDGYHWCGMGTDFEKMNQLTGAEHLSFYHDTMYVLGNFDMVNGVGMNRIAKWTGGNFVDTCGAITGITDPRFQNFSSWIAPNPASSKITFQFDTSSGHTVIIFDQFGRTIKQLYFTSASQADISVSDLDNGMYFFIVAENNGTRSGGKFIVQHA